MLFNYLFLSSSLSTATVQYITQVHQCWLSLEAGLEAGLWKQVWGQGVTRTVQGRAVRSVVCGTGFYCVSYTNFIKSLTTYTLPKSEAFCGNYAGFFLLLLRHF